MAKSGARTVRSRRRAPAVKAHVLAKAGSGIEGLDEVAGGGLPRGRPTLVCGGPGCGKTLFAMEFLVRGAVDHGEPGVLMTFEESEAELAANVASLGFELDAMPQAEAADVLISSLIDTWLQLEVVRAGTERSRLLTVVKSRGVAHAAEAVPYRLSDAGVELARAGRWDGAVGAGKEWV